MDVVLVTKNGMVKRTSVEEFRLQGRGGGGVAAMSLGGRRRHRRGGRAWTKRRR